MLTYFTNSISMMLKCRWSTPRALNLLSKMHLVKLNNSWRLDFPQFFSTALLIILVEWLSKTVFLRKVQIMRFFMLIFNDDDIEIEQVLWLSRVNHCIRWPAQSQPQPDIFLRSLLLFFNVNSFSSTYIQKIIIEGQVSLSRRYARCFI